MSLWIDNLVFGHGRGMRTPYFDEHFYWLVDTSRGRDEGKGALYTWIGGHGAQLTSRQWTMPSPGETRRLLGRDFRPFQAARRGPRVEVSWATKLPADLNAANAALGNLKSDLLDDLMDYGRPKAAPPLVRNKRDREFLAWIADRFVHVHGESPNVGFVLQLRELAGEEAKRDR